MTTTSLNRTRDIIAGWDFTYVVDRAIKNGLAADRANQALSELREFLFQCKALPGTDLSPPSVECDDLWHEFIVSDTRAYFRFCDAVYGGYLHHDGVALSAETLEVARQNSASVFGASKTSASEQAMCGRVSDQKHPMCGRVTASAELAAA